MRPEEILEMRADFACWLINGMVTLQSRREAALAAAVAPPTPAPPPPTRGAGGLERTTIGSLDDLTAFLGRRNR